MSARCRPSPAGCDYDSIRVAVRYVHQRYLREHHMGLDVVEFVLWAEEKYGIDIPDVDAAKIVTVGQFCRYVSGRLAIRAGFAAPSYRAILDDVSHELISSFGVKRDLISERARFVEDLGLD